MWPLLDTLLVYDGLTVPEVWLWREGAFELYLRRGEGGYDRIEKSRSLPELDFARSSPASSPARTRTSRSAISPRRSATPAEPKGDERAVPGPRPGASHRRAGGRRPTVRLATRGMECGPGPTCARNRVSSSAPTSAQLDRRFGGAPGPTGIGCNEILLVPALLVGAERWIVAKTRKKSLYPTLLMQALQKHARVAVRSENHNQFLALFVDNGQLEPLKGPDWRVIIGRRGTGKTFLLKVFGSQADVEFQTNGVLSIYVSAQDCLVSPVGRTVHDDVRALAYFQTFMEHVTDRLTAHIDRILGSPGLVDRILGKASRKKEQLEELMLQILQLVQEGRPIAAFNEGEWTSASEVEILNQECRQAATNASLSNKNAALGVSAGAATSVKSSVAAREQRKRIHIPTPRYALVRDRMIKLLDCLGADHLDILIDEWSALDPTASTSIQPEFAELLKRTFHGDQRFSIKIATNRYQTRFSNRQAGADMRGLELGADIFGATNLDHANFDHESRRLFFLRLLFRRLSFCEPELQIFDAGRTGTPNDAFLRSIFRTERAFDELVRAAEGIPREFLIILNDLASRRGFSVDPLWEVEDVQRCIRERSVSNKDDMVDYSSEADQLLSRCIKDVVTRTGSRLFLVRCEDTDCIRSALEELLEKRLVHEVPGSRCPAAIRDRYDAFSIDYGLWLDWRVLLVGHEDDDPRRTGLGLENPAGNVIDVSPVVSERLRKCPHCDSSFSLDARSYLVRELCPSCFLPAGPSVARGSSARTA